MPSLLSQCEAQTQTDTHTRLWKYNRVTGLWDFQRSCMVQTAQSWLDVYQKDEPDEMFKLDKRRPSPDYSV